MGSHSKLSSGSLSMRRTRRSTTHKKPCKSQNSSRLVDVDGGGGRIGPCTSVSEKLEALKQLIPANNGEIQSDQLFKETADYIVLLRTQTYHLKKEALSNLEIFSEFCRPRLLRRKGLGLKRTCYSYTTI